MQVLAQLLNILLPSAALVAGVWLALRLLRPNAATRCAVWCGVLVLLAVLPFVPFEREPNVDPVVYLPSPPLPQQQDIQAVVEPAPLPATPAADLMDTVPVLYAAGVLLLLARLVVDYLRIRGVVRTAQPLAYGGPQLSTRAPRVLLHNGTETPFAAGFLKPAIVLPASLPDQLSDAELQHVLLHETAHIARRDDWTNLFAQIIRAVCWPNPFVALVMRRIDSEREQACDDWVVASTGNAPVPYAKSLAKLMEIGVARHRQPALASSMVGRGGIRVTQRVEKLLDRSRTFVPRVSLFKLAMSLACLGLLAVICIQAPPVAAFEEPPSKPSAPVPTPTPAAPKPKPGLLAALAETGYKDLPVDDIIKLKEHGVTPQFLREMTSAGWGKLSVDELTKLHNHGVKPAFAAQIHSLGFGPYSTDEVIDMANHGVRPDFFRSLKQYGITKISAREAMEASQHGLNGESMQEARKYGPNLTFEQILKLKRAGVI
ncbi:hypothetical protein F183_A52010 [Bryobacterales bacterium F-183]|nr:hypothetical protein F183_A52010 [Bryobacterales bacterium F-183]